MEENKGFKVVTCQKAIARVTKLFTDPNSDYFLGSTRIVDHKLGFKDEYYESNEWDEFSLLDEISIIQMEPEVPYKSKWYSNFLDKILRENDKEFTTYPRYIVRFATNGNEGNEILLNGNFKPFKENKIQYMADIPAFNGCDGEESRKEVIDWIDSLEANIVNDKGIWLCVERK